MLVGRGRDASLHFFVANLGAMRKQLFPTLQVVYRRWLDDQDPAPLAALAKTGAAHWRETAMRMLALHERDGSRAASAIAAMAEEAVL
jgi:hypothetical protein